ncbi:CDP-glucose 4,6-dehydratase [Breoghania sp. L-A4]|uniref:CDP-glucose 4,6-dehydratase n=1 Tax=Breoghania sp. L-A4 TaxID=2304600 RepID=UPI0020BD50BD|nr:CDP-glucose 4,6-dehydratase [Breoghania sp. L-A4]
MDPAFWSGRRVLLTGHTGFKGSWAALWLRHMGAQVHGLALAPEGPANLYEKLGGVVAEPQAWCDLRDLDAVRCAVDAARPDFVLHMAAQAFVRRSYAEPVATFETNVQGTVNLLEALRGQEGLRGIVAVTSDKVYRNDGSGRAFRETDPLGGCDPYSASKAACEHAVAAYAASFFEPAGVRVATVRGGNVIGGGDFSQDRILPDIWRAIATDKPLVMRNPASTRPWQHVLDCLSGYFTLAEYLLSDASTPRQINIGPSLDATLPVLRLAEIFIRSYGADTAIEFDPTPQPPEAPHLSIDPCLAAERLGWQGSLDMEQAVRLTAEWYARHDRGGDARALCLEQIDQYLTGPAS